MVDEVELKPYEEMTGDMNYSTPMTIRLGLNLSVPSAIRRIVLYKRNPIPKTYDTLQ